jgi:hypothetical protein
MNATTATIARWLLIAVGLDLLVTRVASRLAIFVPKEGGVAAVAGWVGRLGAVADTLVPIIAALLLAALLFEAGRRPASWRERVGLLSVTAVAVMGIAGLVTAPTPEATLAGQVLVLVAALLLVLPDTGADSDRLADAGRLLLVFALACGALARAGAPAAALLGKPFPVDPTLSLVTTGELAFVAGAAAVGVAGISRATRRARSVGLAIAAVLVAQALVAPDMTGILLIWSLGLTGLLPLSLYAIVAGLAIAGLAGLSSDHSARAIGLAIVLMAGNAPAASGLLLASLLGLVIARTAARATAIADVVPSRSGIPAVAPPAIP